MRLISSTKIDCTSHPCQHLFLIQLFIQKLIQVRNKKNSDLTPPIYDSTIQTSTIPNLSSPILTPTNPTMSNTAHLKKKKCDMCDNLIKVNDALVREKKIL